MLNSVVQFSFFPVSSTAFCFACKSPIHYVTNAGKEDVVFLLLSQSAMVSRDAG